nr:hypothetical protein [Tanacetum cinerariifolium]
MYRASNLKCIKTLEKELEELKLEKDGLDGKLAGLLKASKNIDHLIKSQRSDQTGLPEFVDDTITDYSRPSPTVASTSTDGQNKDSSTFESVASPNPPKSFVKIVKPKDNQPESKKKEQETPKKPQVKYAEQVQKETTRSQNHTYRSPSHRSGGHRPHGAPMRPPLRSVGHRPHGTTMSPSNRPAGHRPHGPSMNPIRPNMNDARPNRSFFIQASSYETRPFNKSSAVKTPYRAPWVCTVNRNTPPVNRKFSTEEIFPLTIGNFPLLAENLPLAAQKITLLIWEGREKLSDKNKEGLGYTTVPPPPAQLYFSPKKGLSRTGLPKCVDDIVTAYSRPSPTVESTSEDDQNRIPSVSDNVASPITPKPFIKFMKPKDSQSKRYNAVPPPAANLYRSLMKDLSWTGLPEFADDTVTAYSRPSPTVESTSTEGQNKHSTIAENGESTDSILSKPAVKFVKAGDKPAERPTTNKVEFVKAAERPTTDKFETAKKPAIRYAEMYRRTSKRETTRSQNHAYKSPSHRTYGAPMRPSHGPASHRPHGPPMRPIRSNMNDARPRTSAVRP